MSSPPFGDSPSKSADQSPARKEIMVIAFNASDQGNIPLYMRTLTYKCILEVPTHTESFVPQMFIENLLCAGHHLGTEDVEVEEL